MKLQYGNVLYAQSGTFANLNFLSIFILVLILFAALGHHRQEYFHRLSSLILRKIDSFAPWLASRLQLFSSRIAEMSYRMLFNRIITCCTIRLPLGKFFTSKYIEMIVSLEMGQMKRRFLDYLLRVDQPFIFPQLSNSEGRNECVADI